MWGCFLQDSSSRAAVIAASTYILLHIFILLWHCICICWYATGSVGSELDKGACAWLLKSKYLMIPTACMH